jgi:structural maintenance of chromosome 4
MQRAVFGSYGTPIHARRNQYKLTCMIRGTTKPNSGDVARIAALNKQIDAANREVQALEEKTASIESEIKALEDKILQIGGARLLAQKSKVDGIRLHLNLANDEITKAEVAKSKAEKDAAKLEKSLRSNGESSEQVEAELEDLETQLEECNEYLSELKAQVDQAQSKEENQKEDLDQLKRELEEKEEQVAGFRKRQVRAAHAWWLSKTLTNIQMELEQSLADAKKEAAENDKYLQHWQSEHDKLRLVDIE